MATTLIVGVGLVYASLCTDEEDDAALRWLNQSNPTGLDHGWKISSDETFASGQPNPSPCEVSEGFRHVLCEC